jgi:CheY-like chemotaxis protein
VDLTPLVRQVLELEAHDLRVRGIEVFTDLDRTARIHGDAGQLQQVLVNLISNSVHAMSRARRCGTLRIRLRVIDDRLVRIEIADDGPGIPAHSQPLFTTKPPGEGTGLGLPICQDIVRTHGGSLALLDAPGGGLLVRIDMPVGEPEASREEPDSARAPQELGGRRVLVVDDEPLVRDLLAELLRDAGCRVTAADSGEAALAVLRETEPDVVVSDVRMPGLGGAELYRRASEIRPELRHRFLFVSGDTADPDTWSFLSGSGCESVQKPFQSDAVLAAVTRTLAL